MSYGFRTRVQRTQYLWDTLTEEEKKNPLDWCPISDQLIHEQEPGADIDQRVEQMSASEFRSLFNAVMRRYRTRKKKIQQYLQEQEQEEEKDLDYDRQEEQEEEVAAAN